MIILLCLIHAVEIMWSYKCCSVVCYSEHAPSIIFMDEIDSIGSTRLEGGSGG